jgi:hypothetical protein
MASPTQTQTYTSNIPEELMPYARTMLDTAAGFTDIAANPFQQYQGERVAQASPLLQQAQDTASQMGVAGQIGSGTALAGTVGLEALNPYSFTDAGVAQQYMSPYMQNVVDVQQQQARRQAEIAAQGQQAQAVNAGAFGGSRDAIMRAQGNADLQRNMQGIQATGLQNAYQQGAQQYNQEQGQRMQGLQMANTAANTLGTLGQAQFGQTSNIVGLQGQFGQQEQQRAQQGLDAQYQDFLNYQNYPYKQLGFMSDLIRGVPTTTAASSIYQAPPSSTQSLMSLGLGAYGLNSLFGTPQTGTGRAAGGSVQSYADGGSVMSPSFKRYAVDSIDPRQLPMAQRNAQARGDMDTAQYATEEMAQNAALRRGIAGALPQGAEVVRAAGGGILAFKEPTLENNFSLVTEPPGSEVDENTQTQAGGESRGDPGMQRMFSNKLMEVVNRMEARRGYTPLTPQERRQAENSAIQELRTAGGADPYAPALADLQTQRNDRVAALQQGKGLAALEAAGAVLEGNDPMRGMGKGISAFSKVYGQARQADTAEKKFLSQMQFNLADAQRKENMGLFKESRQSVQNAELARANADKAATLKDQAIGNILGRGIQGTRPTGGGAGAGNKLPQVDRETAQMQDQLIDLQNNPNANPAQIKALENKIAGRMKILATGKDIGPEKADIELQKIAAATDKEIDTLVNKNKFMNDEWQRAMGDVNKQAEVERRIRSELINRRNDAKTKVNKNSGNSGKVGSPPPGFVPDPN